MPTMIGMTWTSMMSDVDGGNCGDNLSDDVDDGDDVYEWIAHATRWNVYDGVR